jgi:hypothetical protein
MKKAFFITTTFVLLIVSCAMMNKVITPTGNKKTEVYQLQGFNSIAVSGSVALEISNGSQNVEINTFENVYEYLVVEIRNGTLMIKTEDVSFSKNPEIRVKVNSDIANSIKASGSSDLHLNNYNIEELKISNSGSNKVTGNIIGSLNINSSGSSNTTINLESKSVNLVASGSSQYILSGLTDDLKIDFAGSSNVNAFDLQTQNVNISASGSSKINLNVEKSLNVRASGSSTVNYKGNPSVSVHNSGSSKVKKVD